PLKAADQVQRRTVLQWIVAAGASPIGAPRALGADDPAKVYRIGFVEAGSRSANQHFLDAFIKGLRELGYIEGRNVTVDVRWAEGRQELFAPLLTELVDLRCDVIVVASAVGAFAAKQAVKAIPVVFVGVSDPVSFGIVNNLARPGGNLTGLSRGFG